MRERDIRLEKPDFSAYDNAIRDEFMLPVKYAYEFQKKRETERGSVL